MPKTDSFDVSFYLFAGIKRIFLRLIRFSLRNPHSIFFIVGMALAARAAKKEEFV